MLQKKSISVVIPNYNGKELLAEFLPSTLLALQQSHTSYEVIIVDDGSKDDSIVFIRSEYPQIKLVANERNMGFSYSCNKGIEASECDLILLLNSDVKLCDNYFEPLFEYFSDTDAFGVMGRIIDMEGDNIQDSARLLKFNGYKLKSAFYYTLDKTDLNYSLYLSGANALVDAKKIKELGGFNELFSPFYGEDLELSIRAWRLGWKCYYEHQSICRHKASASTSKYKTPTWVKSIYYRNRFIVHAIHLPAVTLVIWFLQITFTDLIPKLLIGNFWIWKSYRDLLKNWAAIKRSRSEFQKKMYGKGSKLSIFELESTIKRSLQNKRVVRL